MDARSSAANGTPAVRVFAVDDHPTFLRSVAAVVAATSGFELVGTASTGNEALIAMEERDDLDMVLLDVHLPDISGIDVARRYASQGSGVLVVLMSTTDFDDLPADAFTGGVGGFVAKESLTTATLEALWSDASDDRQWPGP